jgi:hypothetical protein
MANGKPLSLIGAILALVGTFALNWVAEGTPSYVSGINGFMNFTAILDTPFQNLLIALGYPEWMNFVVLLLVALIALAGIMGLIGAKNKAFSAIGGIIAFVFAGLLIVVGLQLFDLGQAVNQFLGIMIIAFSSPNPVVEGIIPFTLDIAGQPLGTILIAVGGLLMLISAFMERDFF